MLRVYAQVRQPRSQSVWEVSHRAGDILHERAGGNGRGRFKEFHAIWDSVLDYDPETGVHQAIDELVSSGIFKRPC